MAKCIYDCARCELDVDKGLCCQFQTLRLLVALKEQLTPPSAEPPKKKTISDLVAEVDTNVTPE